MIVSAEKVELEHASRMRAEFLASMSHELRAPLNVIIGFAEALKDGLVGPMTAAQNEHVGDIFNSGQQLLSLINDRLDPSKDHDAGVANMGAIEIEKRIALVIDDDDKAAGLLRLFLEAEGLAVIRAVSAEDALLLVSRQALALITLDLQMYGMNGWQFLKQLRENSSHGHAPVVIISGSPVGNLAQTRGAAAVLLKPISRSQLNSMLASLGLLAAANGATR